MRILIADDESIIRMGLKAMLNEMGHEVLAAHNGREALQLARHHQPDLAILDIKMPYTDGLQAAKILSREHPMPLLFLTAFSQQELVEQAADLPIHGYLIKPIQPEELAAAITIAVHRFQDSQQLQQRANKLEEKLAGRKLLDRAKGKLMAAGLSEEEAYQFIQQRARRQRQSLQEAAQTILQTAVAPKD